MTYKITDTNGKIVLTTTSPRAADDIIAEIMAKRIRFKLYVDNNLVMIG